MDLSLTLVAVDGTTAADTGDSSSIGDGNYSECSHAHSEFSDFSHVSHVSRGRGTGMGLGMGMVKGLNRGRRSSTGSALRPHLYPMKEKDLDKEKVVEVNAATGEEDQEQAAATTATPVFSAPLSPQQADIRLERMRVDLENERAISKDLQVSLRLILGP